MAQFDDALSHVITPAVKRTGDTMSGPLQGFITVDTRANILLSTPTANKLAFASDTDQFYLYDGTSWRVVQLTLSVDTDNQDMGYTQGSTKQGYYSDGITDKNLYNATILGNSNTTAGSIRTTTGGQFQIYLNGVWNNIVINFVFREDTTQGYTLEHQPVGYTNYYTADGGSSIDNLGLDGYPLTQQYTTSMGAYPGIMLQMNGGVF